MHTLFTHSRVLVKQRVIAWGPFRCVQTACSHARTGMTEGGWPCPPQTETPLQTAAVRADDAAAALKHAGCHN